VLLILSSFRKFFSNIQTLARGQLAKQLLRGSIGTAAIKLSSTLLGVSLVVLLARVLGTEEYGTYTYVFALISVLALPSQLGLPMLVLRETAKAQAVNDWALMRGIWRWAGTVVGIFSLVLVLISILVVWKFSYRLTHNQLSTFWLGLFLVPLIALGNVRGAALRGLKKVVQGQLPEFVLRPALFAGLVLAAATFYTVEDFSAFEAMGLHVIAAAISFACGVYLLWVYRPVETVREKKVIYETRYWISSLIPLGVIAATQVANRYADILILGHWVTASEIGLYRVATQASIIVGFGFMVASMVLAPHLAHLFAVGELKKIQRLVTVTSQIMVVSSLCITLVLVLFGEEILIFFCGAEYQKAYLPMTIISLGKFATAAVGPVVMLLGTSGHERSTLLSIVC
jgi:O-antigen/teichoic acid export membrane protein